jgi:type VI secretion system protein ImpE
MLADQYLREGRLQEALNEVQAEVRKNPAKAEYRVFLFQLLTVLGQWERALNQLKVIRELDASALTMVYTYTTALHGEALRSRVFSGQSSPLVFGDPEPWIAKLTEALRLTAQGQDAPSQALRDQAFEQAPAISGSIGGQDFQWIADADPRLGPILEAIVNGHYYWIPFQRIRNIRIEEPSDLRDLVWMPAYFTWTNGGEAVGLIPARYPGSEVSSDDQIRLARKTDWIAHHANMHVGLGQRMFVTDADEYSLMNVRSISMNNPAEPSQEKPEVNAGDKRG